MKYIKWGGPALPPGRFTTFFDATRPLFGPGGEPGGFNDTRADPGDLTPVEQVVNPDLYVSRGLGSYYEPEEPSTGKPDKKKDEVTDGR